MRRIRSATVRDQETLQPAIVQIDQVKARQAVMAREIGHTHDVAVGDLSGMRVERGIGALDQSLCASRIQQGPCTGATH